jgi:uncharacterized phage protein (TIGR02218 family)
MSRVFLATELEGVATFWRVHRRDGVALGFTSHDRDLAFGGLTHRAAPGMVPSAIRTSMYLADDSAEVEGVLAHDTISARDLELGRYDHAAIAIGAVDWETLDHAVLFSGTLGEVRAGAGRFVAELRSAKALLERDPVPRTSPLCRARFCGPGCTLSSARFTATAMLASFDAETNRVSFAALDHAPYLHGELRWLDGPLAGTRAQVIDADVAGMVLDTPLDAALAPGIRARLREGCDHTLATCADRFANAVNFQGEPFLPGNDLLARYPAAS